MVVKKPSFLSYDKSKEADKKVGKAKGKVKLNLEVYKTIIASMTRYSNPRIPEDQWIEAMGLLYGYNEGDDVIITECVPFTHTRKAGHILRVMFDEEDYVLAVEIENKFLEKDPPQFIVGWVHSHPGILVMMSQDDIKNHLAWQTNNPNAIAIVFNHQRLLRQVEMPKRKGDPVKPLHLDPGFKIFRLDDPSRGLESSYSEVEYEFVDATIDEQFIKNAQEFCLWVSKAFPPGDRVLTDYESYIDKTIKKLEDLYTGTYTYAQRLYRENESHRIDEIVDRQLEEARRIIQEGNKMVQIFKMMIPYLEYKERPRLIPKIEAVLGRWDRTIDGFLEKFEAIKNVKFQG